MTDATDRDEDDVALAGEYALRLMDADARRAFARRMEREPALRALVRDWEERLATLADEVPPVSPVAAREGPDRGAAFRRRPRAAPVGVELDPLLGGALTAGVLVLALSSGPAPRAGARLHRRDRGRGPHARLRRALRSRARRARGRADGRRARPGPRPRAVAHRRGRADPGVARRAAAGRPGRACAEPRRWPRRWPAVRSPCRTNRPAGRPRASPPAPCSPWARSRPADGPARICAPG
jgi:hypothetical protein